MRAFIFSTALRCLGRAPFQRPWRAFHGCPPFGASISRKTESALPSVLCQRGQALVEFIILIPIVLMFVWYLVHINLAINKSIVGQKAARSQLFLKLFNHRSGPMLAEFNQTKRSHFYVGVSATVMANDGRPEAPTEMLGVGPNPQKFKGANDDPGEPGPNTPRQRVRIRTVFGICTHRKKTPIGPSDFCATEHVK